MPAYLLCLSFTLTIGLADGAPRSTPEIYPAIDDSSVLTSMELAPESIATPTQKTSSPPAPYKNGSAQKKPRRSIPTEVALLRTENQTLKAQIKELRQQASQCPTLPHPLPSPATSTIACEITPQSKPQTQDRYAFDRVPKDQREYLADRVWLIEQMIVNHGRAYDYRALTLRELQQTLNHLSEK